MNDRVYWLSSPIIRWARNALAVCLLPYLLWLFVTGRTPGIFADTGMLLLALLGVAIQAGRDQRPTEEK